MSDAIKSIDWQEGYRHGLAQCNHHPEAPDNKQLIEQLLNAASELGWEGWEYTRADHIKIEKAVDNASKQLDDLQTLLADIETLR